MTQSVQERHDVGRTARADLPRAALAELHTPADRPDPVALLESQATSRITELVPIRYGRMLMSPFAFYRGAALIMAADLAASPHTGLISQLCGDAHLSNFGLFGTPERNLVFDVNDFDETLPGPWEWDVKRLVASLAIAGRTNGFGAGDRENVVRSCVAGYRTRMRELATMGELAAWYTQTTVDSELQASVDTKFAKAIQQTAAKARTHDSLQAVSKLTEIVDGQSRLISHPPLVMPIEELVGAAQAHQYEQHMEPFMQRYRDSLQDSRRPLIERYRYVAMARKVVGVGSVGLRAWIMLLVGRDNDDPLLLQMKEAQPSVMERYLGASEYADAAQRVSVGQRLMQANSDILLGWLHAVGPDGHEADYYVRQLHDWKGAVSVQNSSPKLLADYARSCGHALARAHARTGDRIAIAAYLGDSDTADAAFVQFAEAYADQNDRDYAALQDAVSAGRVVAESDL
ncbi:hypothetical protein A5784_21520 [Mycobacterium sp. 852013-50091_SCH5140682]|uniref:DUF2252 domain-containing protein n=1 Tax=Mycobacterium sp. 852013-50091_SCH5140682 TaxID=1834109 RepID=UPI0007EB21E3|nr:DUF2252 domain-containing protein [Mycobacterium sp. 852013-50091_SCH5140682]OBC00108.1 hypothetical protein A5784_21520 [Mycobacterium sp. 852013-50091_SCH5140682]